MALLIIGTLLFIGGIILAIFSRKTELPLGVIGGIVALILGVILCISSCISSVPTGYTGILTTFGRVENVTLDAGIVFKAPWQSVVTIDNREQKISGTLSSFSKDIQETKVSISVNYSINKDTAMNLYRQVGKNYYEILINPRIKEVTKNCFAAYAAEQLISQRDILSNDICAALQRELTQYGINVSSVAIEDIDFTDAFTNAVEAKQVATQEKLKAQTQQEQRTMETQQAAERQKIEAAAAAEVARIQAEADAEVARIKAEAEAYAVRVQAEAEAEANEKVAKSVTDDLINYVYANTWDGKLPTTTLGDGVNAFIDIGKQEE